jgi:hypothetical protein
VIVRRLSRAASEALDTPSVRERLEKIGVSVVAPERRSPEYLEKFHRERDRKMGRPDQGQWHQDRMKRRSVRSASH